MRIAEIIDTPPTARRHPPPHPAAPVNDDDVKKAAQTMCKYLKSLQDTKFTIYRPDHRPVLIGDVRDGKLRPADLEQRLLGPTRTGFTLDLEILEPVRRWLSIVFAEGGGPAKRVVRFRQKPKCEPGRGWLWGLDPHRVRKTQCTIGDLIAGPSATNRR